jgi:hypothetical protein
MRPLFRAASLAATSRLTSFPAKIKRTIPSSLAVKDGENVSSSLLQAEHAMQKNSKNDTHP